MATSACWSSQLVTSQRTASARSVAAELLRQPVELVLGARGQHDAVAELHGPARGGRADAAAGSGDDEDG